MRTHSTLLAIIVAVSPLCARTQGLAESFKAQQWSGLVFVSTTMPRASLLEIAREASLTKSTIVLRGFDAQTGSLNGAHQFVHEVNATCCSKSPPGWIVHPKLFEQYNIKRVPAFVLTKGSDPKNTDFSIVSGDISISNALKFMAQGSSNFELRKQAAEIYTKSFSGH
jgi:conjugal transfer pilus assembly protein TrbC